MAVEQSLAIFTSVLPRIARCTLPLVAVLTACGSTGVTAHDTGANSAATARLTERRTRPGTGWFVLPKQELFAGFATQLEDGKCIAANDRGTDRWLVTPSAEAAPGIYGLHAPCDGVAVALPPLDGDARILGVFRVKGSVVYWLAPPPGEVNRGVAREQAAPVPADTPSLVVTEGALGAPARLDAPFAVADADGAPEALFVRSAAGELARWDGAWTRLNPGEGKVTNLVAQPGVLAVVLDEGVVEISRDAGATWSEEASPIPRIGMFDVPLYTTTPRPAGYPPSPRTLGVKCSNMCNTEQLEPPVELPAPINFPVVGLRVEPPKDVMALNGLSLDDDSALRAAAEKQCGREPLRIAVDAPGAAFLCRDGLYFTPNSGRDITRIASQEVGEEMKEIAISQDTILVATPCAEFAPASRSCAEGSVDLFTREGSAWKKDRLQLPSTLALPLHVVPLGDGRFSIVGGGYTAGGGRSPISILAIAGGRISAPKEIALGARCPARTGSADQLEWVQADDLYNLRLMVRALDGGCELYVRASPEGEVLTTQLLHVRSPYANHGFLGDHVILGVDVEDKTLLLSDDAGATSNAVPLPIEHPGATELSESKIECSRVGCDFTTEHHRVLWRWSGSPFEIR